MKNIATIIALALMLTACVVEPPDAGDRVKVGDAVPDFIVTDADGRGTHHFSQADFVGKHSLVLFFSTSCPDCQRELPKIFQAWQALRNEIDFQLVAVSRQEIPATVAEYWNLEADGKPSFATMPYWLDPDRSAFETFADSYVPRIYLIDSHGKVAMMAVETFYFDADRLVELIQGLR